jgi:hypothetical protein
LAQLVLQGLRVLQVEMVSLALTVKTDKMELMAHQVLLVHKVQLVNQAPLLQWWPFLSAMLIAQSVDQSLSMQMARKLLSVTAAQDNQVLQELQALRVQPARQDQPVQVVQVEAVMQPASVLAH